MKVGRIKCPLTCFRWSLRAIWTPFFFLSISQVIRV